MFVRHLREICYLLFPHLLALHPLRTGKILLILLRTLTFKALSNSADRNTISTSVRLAGQHGDHPRLFTQNRGGILLTPICRVYLSA